MSNRPIILVEDNSDDAFLMQSALQSAGVINPIRIIGDGEEALEYFASAEARDDTQRPRLVLLDVKMPFMSGLDVLEAIRKNPDFRTLTVVMLTSSNEPSDVKRALELGANAYVVKPAAFNDLNQLATAIRDFWLKYHQAG